jgi:Domain of unknown function (DUF4410)
LFVAERGSMRRLILCAFAFVTFAILPLNAQDKPTIVVQEFTTATGVSWPYEMKQMVTQTVAELQYKDGGTFDVNSEAPTGRARVYTLNGEVLEWNPGNRAKRVMVGYGSGRETAKIHYWLSDQTGKKVFEREDIIRAEFWGNEYAGSVGQLAHPFADKIATRLKEAKL